MRKTKKRIIVLMFALVSVAAVFLAGINSVNAASELKPYIETVEKSKEGMTLWQMIKTGGFIMLILAFLSLGLMTIIAYNFMTLKISKLSPSNLAEDIINKLESGKEKAARSLCSAEHNIITRVVMSGLDRKNKGPVFAREAMENRVAKEIGFLWQNITYLADIATIAPLIGLLGTVLGMIQAFNVIAFQTAVVKPILLAGGVSKAMVTTAGGLIIAIPAMIFYTYFRAKVQNIASVVENYSADIIKIVEKM
ncbi:MAG: MotA/TolQ/ExbB proton channel family protein [Candidatus Omnitrophica bacterium]|nr:MotA/TolQ/ExbB proton channel family protein [Candidatus Omnitrophota bacterium]